MTSGNEFNDTQRYEGLWSWLKDAYGAIGKDVPEHALSQTNLEELHKRAILSGQSTEATKIVTADYIETTREHQNEALRVGELVEAVGLSERELSEQGQKDVKQLARLANTLDLPDTELSSYMVGLVALSQRRAQVEERRAQAGKMLKQLRQRNQTALSLYAQLRRVLEESEDGAVHQEQEMQQWERNLQVLGLKQDQYTKQVAILQAKLERDRYSPEISHGQLTRLSAALEDSTATLVKMTDRNAALFEDRSTLIAAQAEVEGLRRERLRLQAAQAAAAEATQAKEEHHLALQREVEELQARLGEAGNEMQELRLQARGAHVLAEQGDAIVQHLLGESGRSRDMLQAAERERMEGERQLAHCREQIAQQEERMAHVAQMLTGTSGQRDVPAVAAPPPAPAGVALPHNLLSSPGQLHAGRQPAAPVPLLPVPLPAGTPAAAPPAPASPEPGGSRRHSSGSFSSPVRDLRAAAGPSPIENGFSSVDLPLRGPTGSPALPRAYGRDGGSSEKNGEGSSDGTLGPRAPLPPSRSVSIGDRSSFSASVSGYGSDGSKRWSCICKLEGHTRSVKAMAFAPGGAILWTASSDATIRAWRLQDGACIKELAGAVGKGSWSLTGGKAKGAQGHGSSVTALAVAPNGTLWSGSKDKTIRCWQESVGEGGAILTKCVAMLTGHKGTVLALQLAPDGALWSGSEDATIRKWVGTDCQVVLSHPQMAAVRALAVDRCAQEGAPYAVYSGSADGTIRRWVGYECTNLEGHLGPVNALVFAPGGALWSGGGDRSLRRWQRDRCTMIASEDRHAQPVSALAVDACGHVWSGSRDGSIKGWRERDGICITSMKEHKGGVSALALAPDGGGLWSASSDDTVRGWK